MSNNTCLICLGSKSVKHHSKLRYDFPGAIYRCLNCNFIYLYPRPSDIDLSSYYETEYRDEYNDLSIEKRFEIDSVEANKRLNRIKNEVNVDSNILEIGSGSGAFISLAKNHFKEHLSVEKDVVAQRFFKKKNINVVEDIDQLGKRKFSCIVLFHVLEHFLDPVNYLKKLKENLSDDGKIFIEVPNVDDALIKLYGISEFKNFYYCSVHLSYFSSKTLKNCIEKAGLKCCIDQIQRYDLSNHLKWLKTNSVNEDEKMSKFKFSSETLRCYSQDLVENGLGDTLWGVCSK